MYSPESVRGGSGGEPIGGSENENPLADVREGVWMLRGPDLLPREIGSGLVPVGRDRSYVDPEPLVLGRLNCCRGSYLHLSPFSPLTHVEQGRLASHFW